MPRQARDKHDKEEKLQQSNSAPPAGEGGGAAGAEIVLTERRRLRPRAAGAGLIDSQPRGALGDADGGCAAQQRHGLARTWLGPSKKRGFVSFSYVCPDPVLVKCSLLYTNGSKSPFSYLSGGAFTESERR